MTLTQERERIKTVITENEGGFSLLGWMFRTYKWISKESIDPEAEDVLTQDVQNALDSEAEKTVGDSTEGSYDGLRNKQNYQCCGRQWLKCGGSF